MISPCKCNFFFLEKGCRGLKPTVVIGDAFLGPPGLGGDSFGLSIALDNQSFFTGGGNAELTVAIDTSPGQRRIFN